MVPPTEIIRSCPVEVGDTFYRKIKNMTIPDRLEVLETWYLDGTWFIRAKYMYHAIGPNFEQTFSDVYFQNDDVVIERKNKRRYVNT